MKAKLNLHIYVAIFLDRILKMIYFSVLEANSHFFKKIEYLFLSAI
jgi:hypothetical protein